MCGGMGSRMSGWSVLIFFFLPVRARDFFDFILYNAEFFFDDIYIYVCTGKVCLVCEDIIFFSYNEIDGI